MSTHDYRLIDRVDLTVVGASFAGLACAHAAASRGLSVRVLERKPDAGARPHTTGILVKEVANEWDVPRRFLRKIRRVRLYGPSMTSIDLTRPGYAFYATDTPAVLHWWSREAERQGAVIETGVDVKSIAREDARWRLGRISSRFLVGADGPRSRVARELELGQNARYLRGVEGEVEGVRGLDQDSLHVFLDRKVAPGYIAWIVPGPRVCQIGLAARTPHRPDIGALLSKLAPICDLRTARVVGHRGGWIPVGGPVRPIGREGVALVGDAAGLVSPLTAGGIHTALTSGRAAGLAICDHLFDEGPEPARVLARTGPRFYAKRLLREVFDRVPSDALFDQALESVFFRRLASTVFFHHRGLLSRAAWHDLVHGEVQSEVRR